MLFAAPERRVGRQRQQQRQVHPHPVGHVDRLVGIVDAHVHVDAEDQLLARHELQARDQVAVARARDDPLVLPHGEGMGAGGADRQPLSAAHRLHGAPQPGQLAARLRGVAARRRGDLAHRLHELGLHVALGVRVGRSGSSPSIELVRSRVSGIHDHQLLLDPEGVAGAREPVLHQREPTQPDGTSGPYDAKRMATIDTTSSQLEELLGDDAGDLLATVQDDRQVPAPPSGTRLPGSTFVDSDRSTRTIRNLKWLADNGRLAGTGYVSILPVDQGIEHSGGASFAPNPAYFDPENLVELAVEGGCNAVASTLGVLGAVSRK